MLQLKPFIPSEFRPEIQGANLDESYEPLFHYTGSNINEIILIDVNAICIGPKKDSVIMELEHSIAEKDKILIFYYEEIHLRWSYIINNNDKLFLYRKNEDEQYYIKPKKLYIRGCSLDDKNKYWKAISDFFSVIEIWSKQVLCVTKAQSYNESKLFQLSNSLRKASHDKKTISIGKSYVIKTKENTKFSKVKQNHIVKSLSAFRSRVVDNTEFGDWDWTLLNNLPVLFQEKIDGNDLRIHNIDDSQFAKLSLKKDKVDYRYDSNFNELIDLNDVSSELKEFCQEVAQLENNRLMGIDFIKYDDSYVVLEANPAPAWASYYNCKGLFNGPVVSKIIEILKNEHDTIY